MTTTTLSSDLDLDLDPAAAISYGGLVDASTAAGQVDEEADWQGAVTALLEANVARRATLAQSRRPRLHPLAAHRSLR